MIDLVDRILTWVFATRLARWVAVHWLGISPEKCSMCYVRARWLQFIVWGTGWGWRWKWLDRKRVGWELLLADYRGGVLRKVVL